MKVTLQFSRARDIHVALDLLLAATILRVCSKATCRDSPFSVSVSPTVRFLVIFMSCQGYKASWGICLSWSGSFTKNDR